jgi:acyl carrier protein
MFAKAAPEIMALAQHVIPPARPSDSASQAVDIEALVAAGGEAAVRAWAHDYACSLVAETLRQPGQVDPDASLTALGLDSMMAIEVRRHLNDIASIELPVEDLLAGITVRQLAQTIADLALKGGSAPPYREYVETEL